MNAHLTVADAAARLNYSEYEVRAMLRSGTLRGYKTKATKQGEWRTTVEDIDAMVAELENRPPARRRRRSAS